MYQKNVSDVEIKRYMDTQLSDLASNVKPRIPLESVKIPKNKPKSKKSRNSGHLRSGSGNALIKTCSCGNARNPASKVSKVDSVSDVLM